MPHMLRAGLEAVGRDQHAPWRLAAQAFFLARRPLYVSALLINLSGSLVYYKALAAVEVSVIGPVANALSLLVSVLVGTQVAGEAPLSLRAAVGLIFLFFGSLLCSLPVE